MNRQRSKKSIVMALSLVFILLLGQTVSFAGSDLMSRSQADDKYKWDLRDIYTSRDAFEADVEAVETLLPQIESYAGRLNTADALVELFALDEEASRKLFKAYVYANLMLDLDQTNNEAVEMSSITSGLYGKYIAAQSYVQPEILELDDATLQTFLEDERLKDHRVYLEGLLSQKEHILSKEEEKILSLASDMSGSPKNIFDKVTIADKEKVYIENKDGEEVELTPGLFSQIIEDTDRDYRKEAAQLRYSIYEKVNNTLAATYEAEIKKNVFFSKARGFDSSIEASLYAESIPQSVYDNLIEAVNDNLEPLHKYYKVRKQALGYENLYYYDAYVPLTDTFKMNIPFDEAVDLIAESLQPLGMQYVTDFNKGIDDRWVDAYEDSNKYTGGYQWGTYDTHPFILMNYDDTLNSALTLAHEMGHALNSKYSNQEQPYSMADYPIFTAEVASTVNEMLVMDHLIKNAKTDDEKLYLVNQQIDNIRGTVFVQVMFSEFEKRAHEMVESGQPLSPDVLNELWMELLVKYFGPDYTTLEYQKYGWSRIPHFYMNFYVYKYATSMSAGYSIVNQIMDGKEGALEAYIEFLGAGGSADPITVLKNAGVDMNSSEPVDSLLAYFSELVDELEVLLDKKGSKVGHSTTYLVQPGDVLWKIAKAYGTTWKELAELNDLDNANFIEVGMEIMVPVD
ncbi:oligoendopeptidase F [Fusibacter sp. JL216-2]|uniref:oligoendopeptidase F n=1 Tax=Fusibacter sp. JL216-2 TaxID=3071453 RepID=UPI003D3438CF